MATEVTCIVDTGNGAGTHYTSLAAAIAGETGATPAVVTGANLVTNDEQLTIKCRCTGGTADGAAVVNGFTTDATRYVKIWTDPSEGYRWNDASRGANRRTYPASGNYYRIETSGGSAVLTVSVIHTLVSGIAIKNTTSGSGYPSCFLVSCENASIVFDSCFALGSGTATTGHFGYNIVSSSGASVDYVNCIATGFQKSGTSYYCGFRQNASSSVNYYHCTAFGNRFGFKEEQPLTRAYNCISASNDDDFVNTKILLNCASDDGDGTNPIDISPGTVEATDWAACFVDYANSDFGLKLGSVCIDAGTDDPTLNLPTVDALGVTRTLPRDVGAFEYVSASASGEMSGTSSGSASNSGELGGVGGIGGNMSGTSFAQITVGGIVDFAGEVAGAATGSLSIALLGYLSGEAGGSASAHGWVGGIGVVGGLSQGSVVVTGGLVFDASAGGLIGIITGGAIVDGAMFGIAEMSGSIDGSSYAVGTIRYPGAPSMVSAYRATIGCGNRSPVRMISSRHVRRVGQ